MNHLYHRLVEMTQFLPLFLFVSLDQVYAHDLPTVDDLRGATHEVNERVSYLPAEPLSVRPYHFHSKGDVGVSVLCRVKRPEGGWPEEFYVGVRQPEGWRKVNVLPVSQWDAGAYRFTNYAGTFQEGGQREVGWGFRIPDPTEGPDWQVMPLSEHKHLEMLILFERIKLRHP